VPGKSAESLLVQFVGGLREEGVMPKKGDRLTAQQIGLLRAWIDQGAVWPVAEKGRPLWHPPCIKQMAGRRLARTAPST